MLTLAAMYVLNGTADPVYTSLEVGAYSKIQPKGRPCDAAFPQACKVPLSRGGTIAIAVIVSAVGLVIFALLAWYVWTLVFAGKVVESGVIRP